MKKRRTIWVVCAVVISGTIGALAYLATRENPDYVRAAKLLPEMRQKARDTFGQLTWEEFHEENGIVYSDDYPEWQRIQRTIPREFDDFRYIDPPDPERYGELFEDNKAWFLALPGQLERLLILRTRSRGITESLIPAKNLLNAIAIGIIGAADTGDEESVKFPAETGYGIVEKYRIEFCSLRAVMMLSGMSVINGALLTAVARNRQEESLVALVRDLISGPPEHKSIKEAFAGNARDNWLFFQPLFDKEFFSLNYQLDQLSERGFGAPSAPLTKPSLAGKIREFLSGLSDREGNPRRTGEHTYDALEARLWEVQLKKFEIVSEILKERPFSLEKHEAFFDEVGSRDDLSYEYARVVLYSSVGRGFVQYGVVKDLSQLALDVMAQYPDISSLPERLPIETLPEDLYSTEKIRYRRFSRGFIVYSVNSDGKDNGFPLQDDSRYMLKNVDISSSESGLDFGVVVNYVLP